MLSLNSLQGTVISTLPPDAERADNVNCTAFDALRERMLRKLDCMFWSLFRKKFGPN